MAMTVNYIRVKPQELKHYIEESSLLAHRVHNQADADAARYDIDKSWDGIIFLLTGKSSSDTTEPLSRLIFSNQLVDKDQNLGTGPAHYLLPDEVTALYQQIQAIVPSSLKQKFDAAAMKELGIYPNNVWDEDEVDDYLIEYFETIQEIFETASKNGEAVISFIQ